MVIRLSRETRWAVLGVLVALVALSALMPPSSSADPESPAAHFASEAEEANVPSGAIAVIQDGRITDIQDFGDATPTSRFLWGSVSKPAAAAVTQRLAREGRLDLDAQVSRYVDGGPDATVEDLLDHTAGLPFGADELDEDRPSSRAADVVPTAAAKRSTHAYSSLGYLYLQAVVERASGGSYQAALRRTFPGTGVGASADSCADVVHGHRFVGPWAVGFDTAYDGAGGAYGYTCGSIRDLAAVALAHLRSPDPGPGVPTGHPGQRYAHGWRISTEADGSTTHWHTGTVPGYFSAVHLDPRHKRGIVVLMNASGYLHEEQLAAITRAAYDRTTGRRPAAIPSATAASAVPAALIALAAGLALLAFRRSRKGPARAVAGWVSGFAAVTIALAAAPLIAGYPYRYFWLWEPGLVLAVEAVWLSLTIGSASAAVRCRRSIS